MASWVLEMVDWAKMEDEHWARMVTTALGSGMAEKVNQNVRK